MMAKSVGIVGAGVSGLAAVKSCLDEGLLPVCFELASDLGGLWNYRSEAREGEPSLYSSCVINTSKEMTCYSDFPILKEFPNFMSHKYFQKYLQDYADFFCLRQHINFEHKVKTIQKSGDFVRTGKWDMRIEDLRSHQIRTETVDFVMVCNGHLHEPNIPKFPGLDTFKGRVLHTHDYKDFQGFEGKRILVVGIGNSGADVACELSRHAEHVYISTRRGSYVIQRAGEFGQPFDQVAITRWAQSLPWGLMRPIHYHKINYKYKHSNYGLSPNFRFDAGAVTISDDLPNRILVGAITVHDNVSRFTSSGVVLDDGSIIEDLDIVVLATGFTYSFPFLDRDLVKVEDQFPHLYHLIFPPNVQPCTLAVIGLVQPFGSLPPILEMQARVVSAVFSGRSQLPVPETMEAWIEKRKQFLRMKYVSSPRYNLQIYFIDYLDTLANIIGCRPRLWKYFFTDPKLWYKLYFGPATPPQWRLDGPGRWAGAKEAIYAVEEKTYYPMKTRKAGQGERDGLYDGWITLSRNIVFAFLIFLCGYLWWKRFLNSS